MNCYRHSNLSAVGICKTCFKAVCPDCAIDVGNGLACKGSCEETVRELNEMWERSAKIYGVGKHKSRIPSFGALIWLLLATAMWFSTYMSYSQGKTDYGVLGLAIVFSIGAGLVYYRAKQTGLKC